MRRIAWGILGTARIATHKVIPAMQRSELCEVVAIGSRDRERATAAAGALGIDRAHGSYEALLRDPAVEAVYVPLPNHLHARWTIEAARAGKHVLCEKPLALSVTDAREMIDASWEAGVKLMEAFMYRLHPLWVRVRQVLDSGRLGELRAVQSFFSYRNLDPADIRNIAQYGGGALWDIGCYCVNLSRMLFGGEPSRVSGMVQRDDRFGTDVLTSALLEFEQGHAEFTCSTQIEDDQRVHLHGTAGRLLVEIPFNIPPDRPTRLLLTSGGNPPVTPDVEVITIPSADPYTVQGDLFSRSVLDGTEVPIPPQDAVGNLNVLEAILGGS